jgi:hypothetical protein
MSPVITDVAAVPEPDEPHAGHAGRNLAVAVVISALLVLGIGAWLVLWLRGGGPRRAIKDLAEDGAVKLADALLDEVLPAA